MKDFDTKDDPWEPVMSPKRASKVPSLHGIIVPLEISAIPGRRQLEISASPTSTRPKAEAVKLTRPEEADETRRS